jgi:hypothetical protein
MSGTVWIEKLLPGTLIQQQAKEQNQLNIKLKVVEVQFQWKDGQFVDEP